MNHDAERDLLLAYADGELDEARRREVELHLSLCHECRLHLEELRKTTSFLEGALGGFASGASRRIEIVQRALARAESVPVLPVDPIVSPEPSPPLIAARPARERIAKRRAWQGLVASVALAGAVGLAYVLYSRLGPVEGTYVEVLGASRFVPGTEGEVRIRTADAETGEPAPGREVALYLRTRDVDRMPLGKYRTGEDGTAVATFRVPDSISGEATLLAEAEGSIQPLECRISFEDPIRIVLATDRPIYRPGETIRLRALLSRAADGFPAETERATVEVRDGQDRLLLKEEHEATRFGLVWTELPLDPEVGPGLYHVSVASGGSKASRPVAVRRFVKPQLKVEARLEAADGKGYLLRGDGARLVVEATYYFGEPAAGARVTVRGVPGGVLSGTTDGSGRFVRELRLPADLGSYSFRDDRHAGTLEVRVADAAGNEVETSGAWSVARDEILVEAVPAGGELVRNLPEDVYVRVTDPAGNPLGGTVRLRDREIALDGGYARLQVDPTVGDLYYAMEVRTSEGRVRKIENWLPQTGPARAAGVVVKNPLVLPGEEVELAAYAAPEGPDRLDVFLVANGVLQASRTVELQDGRSAFSLPVPELLAGPALVVWALPGKGPEGQRPVWIAGRNSLSVKASLAVAEEGGLWRDVAAGDAALPGAQARYSFEVSGPGDRPVESAAISLGTIDARIFGVPDLPAPDSGFSLQPSAFSRLPVPADLSPDARRIATGILLARRMAAEEWRDEGSFVRADDREQHEQTAGMRESRLENARWTSWYIAGVILLGGGVWFLLHRRLRNSAVRSTLVVLALSIVPVAILVVACDSDMPADGEAKSSAARRASESSIPYAAREAEPPSEELDIRDPVTGDETPAPEPAARKEFPETLLWEPQIFVVQGKAELLFRVADSMTSWQTDGWAVDGIGRTAAWSASFAVRKDFFGEFEPPARLTRGDEVEFPVQVFNFTGNDIDAHVLASGDGFEFPEGSERRVAVSAGRAAVVLFRLRPALLGDPALSVRVEGGGKVDLLEKPIRVESEGRLVERADNLRVKNKATIEVAIPRSALPGSVRVSARVHQGLESQVLEGLEGLLRLPYG
ncbi:MAG: zf-HC2 domain-containing protein [Planctomycetes bacterium]|nr:zf-HC2 domain-containing protein [Planctomycetota bacterium]